MLSRLNISRFVGALLISLAGMAAAAAATDTSPVLQQISRAGTLRVGLSGNQAPFNMRDRDGKLIGMDVDLARLLANSMGVELELVQMPFAKLLPALEDREVDLVISGVTATLQRNTRVPFVGPYFVTGISVLTKSGTIESMDTPEELSQNEWRIAVMKGSTSEDFAERALNNPKLSPVDAHADAVKLLLADKVDAVLADAPECALSILRNPDANLVSLKQPLTIEPIGIALAPGDPLLVNLVQNYMQALAATGALEALQTKWFKSGSWLAEMPD